jgi:hypothetical protein
LGQVTRKRPSFAAFKDAEIRVVTNKISRESLGKSRTSGAEALSGRILHGTADLSRRAVEAVPFVPVSFSAACDAEFSAKHLLTG